jgi:hypothetical protein
MMTMRDELAATRQALWAAIQAQGGRVAIPKEIWEKFDARKDRTLLLTTDAKKGGIV